MNAAVTDIALAPLAAPVRLTIFDDVPSWAIVHAACDNRSAGSAVYETGEISIPGRLTGSAFGSARDAFPNAELVFLRGRADREWIVRKNIASAFTITSGKRCSYHHYQSNP